MILRPLTSIEAIKSSNQRLLSGYDLKFYRYDKHPVRAQVQTDPGKFHYILFGRKHQVKFPFAASFKDVIYIAFPVIVVVGEFYMLGYVRAETLYRILKIFRIAYAL